MHLFIFFDVASQWQDKHRSTQNKSKIYSQPYFWSQAGAASGGSGEDSKKKVFIF